MITCYDIIKSMLKTEKAALGEEQSKYFFRVSNRATKIDIKNAVEEIYSVKVQDVNVMTVSGKKKRVRREAGYAADWKKAVVTLKDGQKIEVA